MNKQQKTEAIRKAYKQVDSILNAIDTSSIDSLDKGLKEVKDALDYANNLNQTLCTNAGEQAKVPFELEIEQLLVNHLKTKLENHLEVDVKVNIVPNVWHGNTMVISCKANGVSKFSNFEVTFKNQLIKIGHPMDFKVRSEKEYTYYALAHMYSYVVENWRSLEFRLASLHKGFLDVHDVWESFEYDSKKHSRLQRLKNQMIKNKQESSVKVGKQFVIKDVTYRLVTIERAKKGQKTYGFKNGTRMSKDRFHKVINKTLTEKVRNIEVGDVVKNEYTTYEARLVVTKVAEDYVCVDKFIEAEWIQNYRIGKLGFILKYF